MTATLAEARNSLTSPLPDLFPHLVPDGADVPQGTRVCRNYSSGDGAVVEPWKGGKLLSAWNFWTEEPIKVPLDFDQLTLDLEADSGLEPDEFAQWVEYIVKRSGAYGKGWAGGYRMGRTAGHRRPELSDE